MGKLHLNLSAYYEPIDSDPTLEEGTEMMNYYNDSGTDSNLYFTYKWCVME